MKQNEKKKMEFSKKIFYIVITLFIIVVLYSMALMWHTMDTSPLAYLIPSIGGLAATACGFYYWKSKNENLLKIRKSMMDMDMDTCQIDEEIEELCNENFEQTNYEY